MDFELSDDQQALRDAASDLLDDHASPARVRAVVNTGATHDDKLWAAMVEQGWLGVEAAEPDGGLGLGFVELAVLLEELGRRAAPAPFASTVLALGTLRGTAWHDRLLNGAVAAVAWNEAGAERLLVPYAPVADVAVVVEGDRIGGDRSGGGRIVAHDLTTGDRPAREPAMDVTRCLGWLPTDRPGATTLDLPPEAAGALVDRGAVAVAAEALGGASTVLALSVEHAKTRVQFGKPIGSFQAVKHRCADMLVDVEGMRSTTYHAAWALAAGDAEGSVAASTAKAWSGDAARRVMASGLQVHGGIGFTWEHDLHLYMKRAQLDGLTFGTPATHRRRLAALLRDRVAAGESIL
jgi:alkylation response protein AidB-like acyl-CoA dehydrogenase